MKKIISLLPSGKEYLPVSKFSAAIIINKTMFEEKGLPSPTHYSDLIKPIYNGLITMPNPVASGTGYAFLKGMVNHLGEEAAFTYFDALKKT